MSIRSVTHTFYKCDQCGREQKREGSERGAWWGNDSRPPRPDLPIRVVTIRQDQWDADEARRKRLKEGSDAWREYDYGRQEGEFCSQGCAMAWVAAQVRNCSEWPQPQGDGE